MAGGRGALVKLVSQFDSKIYLNGNLTEAGALSPVKLVSKFDIEKIILTEFCDGSLSKLEPRP